MNASKVLLAVALCWTFSLAADSAPALKVVAVSDLTGQGLDVSSASILSDRLRNELFNTGVFTVLERGQMDEILKEQGFQQSGCTSDACAVEIGQLLGVQYLVIGSIGKIGQTFTINVRMIDVTTGRIVLTANTDCRCEIDLLLSKSTIDISEKLARGIGGGAPKTAAAQPAPAKTENAVAAQSGASAQTTKTAPAAPARKKRLNPLIKVGFGVAALAAAGAGIGLNAMANGDVKRAEDAKAAYLASGNPTYDSNNKDYQNAYAAAKQKVLIRNIMYGVAGAAVLAFGITVPF